MCAVVHLSVSVKHTRHTHSRTPADLLSLNSGSEFFFSPLKSPWLLFLPPAPKLFFTKNKQKKEEAGIGDRADLIKEKLKTSDAKVETICSFFCLLFHFLYF